MRVLILGAGGMLGHKLVQLLQYKYEVTGTVRKSADFYDRFEVFQKDRLIGNVDSDDFNALEEIIFRIQPHYIVNCIGIIKQLDSSKDPVTTITTNSLLPHRIARCCQSAGSKLIQISTDCVFSGNRGMYKEEDIPDARDLYGLTKYLGELDSPHCLTLRTSIIGRELYSRNGLLEWFIQTRKRHEFGYRNAIYTGLTCIELARVIERVICAERFPAGLYHVSSDTISKYDLLILIRDAFNLPTQILPVDTPVIDRSLDSTRFRQQMAYSPPSWPEMIQDLAKDQTKYSQNRKNMTV